MKYFDAGGWWMPDREAHLQGWMNQMNQKAPGGRKGYQLHKYEAALSFTKQRRRAIDVGGHVGLWSWPMAHDFDTVDAFEPHPQHRECWAENMKGRTNASLHPYALGPRAGTASLRTRTRDSSGDTGVEPSGDGDMVVEMFTLDEFGFQDVDFIKLDCEGYELFVLQGAKKTILNNRPVIIVEQKPETGMEARYGIQTLDGVEFLKSLGMIQRQVLQGDYIMAWE